MAKTIELKRGDACPSCGGELKAARVPTPEQFAKSQDRENPVSLLPGMDTATPEQRADLGDLFRCPECGYNTRFAPVAAKAGKGAKKDDE
jgi:rRNA maturation protein Nop10